MCVAADRIQAGRTDRELYCCRQDAEREERQGAIQLQKGYRERELCSCRQIQAGRKQRELGSCRQSTSREEIQRTMQLQTGRKDRELGSCRQDSREERQGARQMQTGY